MRLRRTLDLPAQSPAAADQSGGGCLDEQIGEMHKPSTAVLTSFGIRGGLEAFNPMEPLSVIVHRIEPAQLFGDLDLALEASMRQWGSWGHRLQGVHLFPHRGQIPLLEGDNIAPIVALALLEKALIRV